jgi:hypothetical protein
MLLPPTGCSKRPFSKAAADGSTGGVALGYVEDAFEARTQLADFFSILLDGVVGKAQVQEAAETPFLRTQETGKAQADSFSRAGADKGAVDHDGIIVLGRMKFQHHLATQRKTLLREHTAPSQGQIRERALDNDPLAGIMDGAHLCWILDRDPVIVATRIGCEPAEEGGKAVGTELTTQRVNSQGAEEPISHPMAWSESCLHGPAFRATVAAHFL